MSSSFVGALVCRKVDGDLRWEVAEAFEYHVGALGSDFRIRVPAHFPTDGASIPRLLWVLWPPFGGLYDQAAALHDFLYRTMFDQIARALADAIFYEAMEVLKVKPVTRWCIYLGVRAGGWMTYRQYKRAALRKTTR